MTDLVEFIRARLDEDERIARGEITRREVWQSKLDRMRRVGEMVGVGLIDYDEPGAPGDPARVLADVDAKRRIISRCERLLDARAASSELDWAADVLAHDVLRDLAASYVSHPDYSPTWAPADEPAP